MTTVLLLAHPDFAASRANRALLAGLNDLPGLEVAELYALYPNGQIDVTVERARVLRADRLVLQVPTTVVLDSAAAQILAGCGADAAFLYGAGHRRIDGWSAGARGDDDGRSVGKLPDGRRGRDDDR